MLQDMWPTSGLSNLIHIVISLPYATSYYYKHTDTVSYKSRFVYCLRWLPLPIVQWEHSGSVLECLAWDLGATGRASPAWLCYVLTKTHLFLLSTGLTQEGPSRHKWKSVDWHVKKQIKSWLHQVTGSVAITVNNTQSILTQQFLKGCQNKSILTYCKMLN